jgi:hypothetical protein
VSTAPGPLAEEAARLVEALSDWAKGQAGDLPGTAEPAPECRLCPFCQALALVRQAKPETFAHLLDASAALTAALRSMVETHAHGAGAGGVERIVLDDEPPGPVL